MGSRLLSRAKNEQLAKVHVMWPLPCSSSRPAKIRLRPGIAHGRGPLLHRRDSWTLHCSLPLFATQTTTTERIRDIQSHGVASTQQTPPSNHLHLAYHSATFYLEPCNTPISCTRTALTRPINKHPTAGVPRRRCRQIMEWSQSMPKALL